MPTTIRTADVPAFESTDRADRRATIDAVGRSLETGFTRARHGLPTERLGAAHEVLGRFFGCPSWTKARCAVPHSRGQTDSTGLMLGTAAGATRPDLEEMLDQGALPDDHPLRRAHPHRSMERVFADVEVSTINGRRAR